MLANSASTLLRPVLVTTASATPAACAARAARLRFFDRLVFAADPSHAASVSAYEKALRERLRFVKEKDDKRLRDDTAQWLGDAARFWPCDEALGRWRGIAHAGQAQIVYE